jgi:NAD-reducing hydrogenase large subunit
MTRQIVIDPVTRAEGHARISIQLDDQGGVADARFHVTQLRGFEKLCEGRPFYEMPSLMARICGICPVSHLIASAKACDALLAVQIPPAADKLRRILNLGQIVQSHALNFFYLSSPDLLLGLDSDPAGRNIFGMIQSHPSVARDGIRLRQFGQQVVEWLAGKRIHPAWVVPGGVSEPLPPENRDRIAATVPEAKSIILRTLDWFKRSLDDHREEIQYFANFPTLFLGLVKPDGSASYYHGNLRLVDASGKIVADQVAPALYEDYIGEAVEPWSFLKFPYYKPAGYPAGIYRVGPLARINLADGFGTPLADQEKAEFHAIQRTAVLSSFYYHYARLIEILYCIERIELLLDDPEILSRRVRAIAHPNSLEGIGVSEAPRGTLIHHYKIDEQGLMRWANLIIATGHNNLAMNRGILQVARRFVDANRLEEGMLNRVEAVIRAFDPCLSCSTHAWGKMPLSVELVDSTGTVLHELRRDR